MPNNTLNENQVRQAFNDHNEQAKDIIDRIQEYETPPELHGGVAVDALFLLETIIIGIIIDTIIMDPLLDDTAHTEEIIIAALFKGVRDGLNGIREKGRKENG